MTAQDAHLLIVDDDDRIRQLLGRFLVRQGFRVTTARDAGHARRILAGLDFDLIVIDVMMPGEDGVSLCGDLRVQRATPIILLTARGGTEDRIRGLEAGADDYVAKPFEPRELVLRINAILRRVPEEPEPTRPALSLGHLRYDPASGDLSGPDGTVHLTSTEMQLMALFAKRPGTPFARGDITRELGRGGDIAQERAVDVQITRLRRKLEPDPKQPRYLQTVRGAGYMLAPD